jgi:hypothetical protein
MKEANEFIICTTLGFGRKELETFGSEALHFGMNIVHLKSQMVNALAAFVEVFSNGAVGVGGFQQFNFGFAVLKKSRADVLGGNFLYFVMRLAE